MKVTVDETTFNKAIRENKFELAKWLLEVQCPTDKSCYLQNLTITALDWLKANSISISPNLLWEVLDNSTEKRVVEWFIKNNCIVDIKAIYSCIKQKNHTLFIELLSKYKLNLDIEAYRPAIVSENIQVLDYLLSKDIILTEEYVEYAMKNKKKEAIKWMVSKDLFF